MAGKKKRAKGPAKPKAAKGGEASPAKAGPKAQATKKEEKKGGERKPEVDLSALKARAQEGKAALDKARKDADALRERATAVVAAAKKVYAEALAPYRDACRKAGKKCELPGIKAPSTLPRARFLIEKVKGGLKVAVKDRAKSEEVIPDKKLKESIWRAAREYCARQFGKEWTGGRARGLGLRFKAALADK